MAWTAPKTWTVGEPLTAPDLNAQLRDNMLALKTPPTALVKLDEPSDYTTTSTVFVPVDTSRLSLSLTTSGGDVMIVFFANIANSTQATFIDIEFDGVMIGGDEGLGRAPNLHSLCCISVLKTGVAAGGHTIRLMWRVSAASTSTLYAGVTAGFNTHAHFWAREV
jgi:hypothetical protein